MSSSTKFSCVMTMISYFMILFLEHSSGERNSIVIISTKSFITYATNVLLFLRPICFYKLVVLFLFFHSQLFSLHPVLSLYKIFSHNLYLVTIKLVFCCIKWIICKQWITRRRMLSFFSLYNIFQNYFDTSAFFQVNILSRCK